MNQIETKGLLHNKLLAAECWSIFFFASVIRDALKLISKKVSKPRAQTQAPWYIFVLLPTDPHHMEQ